MVGQTGNWTHAICVVCWNKQNPQRGVLDRKVGGQETCCFCGIVTRSGIYVREDPKLVHPQALKNTPGN